MIHNESIRELQDAMRQASNPRDYERYQAVSLSLSGYSNKEIAKIIGRCGHTAGNYIRAYKERGLSGLERVKPPGKKSHLTDEQRLILKETIAYKTPDEVGFPARSNWTLLLGAQFIEREFGVSYTQKGVSKLFHALGLSYTRPTYTLKKADPQRQRQFKEETFPALKKAD